MPVPLMIHVRVTTCDPAVVTDVVAGGTRPALRAVLTRRTRAGHALAFQLHAGARHVMNLLGPPVKQAAAQRCTARDWLQSLHLSLRLLWITALPMT